MAHVMHTYLFGIFRLLNIFPPSATVMPHLGQTVFFRMVMTSASDNFHQTLKVLKTKLSIANLKFRFSILIYFLFPSILFYPLGVDGLPRHCFRFGPFGFDIWIPGWWMDQNKNPEKTGRNVGNNPNRVKLISSESLGLKFRFFFYGVKFLTVCGGVHYVKIHSFKPCRQIFKIASAKSFAC